MQDVGDEEIRTTATVGMTVLDGSVADAREVLTRADAAMYDGNVAGRTPSSSR